MPDHGGFCIASKPRIEYGLHRVPYRSGVFFVCLSEYHMQQGFNRIETSRTP